MNVERYVVSFHKQHPHSLAEKFFLPSTSLSELKMIFEISRNDPLMYHYYDVETKHAEALTKLYGIVFDMDKFDYAVGAEATKIT